MDALVTNFHLPESTLIMLVSALAGREHVLAAYKEAVEQALPVLLFRRRHVYSLSKGERRCTCRSLFPIWPSFC